MKRNEIIGEVSLGDYRKKAQMQKAQSQMGAMFGRDPEQRAKDLATFQKREKGLNRLKARDEKARKAQQDRDLADLVARLPELRAKYNDMRAKYKSLGGSDWQYADREQNLTDREREARSMEGPMNNLWRQIQAAEKAQKSESVSEGAMKDFAIQDVVDQLLDGDLDPYDVMSHPQGPAQEQMSMVLQDMYDDVVTDTRLHPDDDFEEILDRVMDRVADDYGHSADNESIDEAGMLKVAKDDEKQTVLLNPATGVQTQIDKQNPNAPRLTQDDKGKLTLTMPQGAQTGGLGQDKPQTLVGKEVQVSQMPEMIDIKRLAGL